MKDSVFEFDIHLIKNEIPKGLYELRRDVYSHEYDFLKESQLITPDDEFGQHVCVYQDDYLIAAMLGMPAQDSPFPRMTGTSPTSIADCYFSTKGIVRPEYRSKHSLWPLLSYLTFAEGLNQGFEDNLSLFENKTYVELLMDIDWLTDFPPIIYEGNNNSYQLHPGRVSLKYGMEESWEVLQPQVRKAIATLIPENPST